MENCTILRVFGIQGTVQYCRTCLVCQASSSKMPPEKWQKKFARQITQWWILWYESTTKYIKYNIIVYVLYYTYTDLYCPSAGNKAWSALTKLSWGLWKQIIRIRIGSLCFTMLKTPGSYQYFTGCMIATKRPGGHPQKIQSLLPVLGTLKPKNNGSSNMTTKARIKPPSLWQAHLCAAVPIPRPPGGHVRLKASSMHKSFGPPDLKVHLDGRNVAAIDILQKKHERKMQMRLQLSTWNSCF